MFERLLKWLRETFKPKEGEKVHVDLSMKMETSIRTWSDMYETGGYWVNRKKGVSSLRLPSILSSEMAKLVLREFEVSYPESARAEFLEKQLTPFFKMLRDSVQVACAMGGVVFKPFVSPQGNIVVDVIQADRFFPEAFDSSKRMTAAVFVQEIQKSTGLYTRIEYQRFTGSSHEIINRAYYSRSGDTIGNEIALADVPEWENIAPEALIQNVDVPLFAYFKMPNSNTADRFSPLGASIYAEAVDLIKDADEQYGYMRWEYKGGQMAVDIGEDLLLHPRNDGMYGDGLNQPKTIVPEFEERLYRGRSQGAMDDNFYEIFAPQLRDDSYRAGLNEVLQRIEFNCGLSYGTISDPSVIAKTATEVLFSKDRSLATVQDIQKQLEEAIIQVVYIIDVWATLYNLAPQGDTGIMIDWGDAVGNDPKDRKKMFWQYVMSGKFPFWRYLVEFEGYSIDEAKEIQAEQNQSVSMFPEQEY